VFNKERENHNAGSADHAIEGDGGVTYLQSGMKLAVPKLLKKVQSTYVHHN